MLTPFIETYITNINFILLFVTMIFYWLKSALFLSEKYDELPSKILIVSGVFQTLFLCLRWKISNHFPLSNLYESLLFLSWSLTIVLIFLNKNIINPQLSLNDPKKQLFAINNEKKLINSMFGSILIPLILLLNTFATFSLPMELRTSSSLVPALQSNWLVMHVTVMMLSYAALFCGCLFSIAYLILNFLFAKKSSLVMGTSVAPTFAGLKLKPGEKTIINNRNKVINTMETDVHQNKLKTTCISIHETGNFWLYATDKANVDNLQNKPAYQQQPIKEKNSCFEIQTNNGLMELKTLDNLSYRMLGLGFPLLTIGILSGAVWANQTWGSYWSWDPKETWALITWFIFAIYLHTRLSKGWTGQKSALLASFGFVIIWICYLGVNLMGKGLHSYGFFT